MGDSPRDMQEWMRTMERRVAAANRAAGSAAASYGNTIREEVATVIGRTPAPPIELNYQTSLYIDPRDGRQKGRVIVDFPDVTKATDGTEIEVIDYELWCRDVTANPLIVSTSAVAGVAAPGLTLPGLAKTPATAAAVDAPDAWRRIQASASSTITATGFPPGSVLQFKVRAIAEILRTPGIFSPEEEVQLLADTTPPPQPTAPKLTVSHGTITVEWDGLSVLGPWPADLDYITVAHGVSSSPINEVHRFTLGDQMTVLGALEYYKMQYVRFQAVDLAGNRSPWSEQAFAFTTPLVDADIILSRIDAATTTIENIGAASILSGAILESKLAENAVTLGKLAAGAVDLTKLTSAVTDKIQQGIDDAYAANQAALAADDKAGDAQAAADFAKAEALQGIANLAANAGNMAPYGDLESLTDGTYTRLFDVPGEAHSGTRAFKSTVHETSAYGQNLPDIPVVPGNWYQIGFWIKASADLPGAGAGMPNMWVTDDGTQHNSDWGAGYSAADRGVLTPGVWKRVQWLQQAPMVNGQGKAIAKIRPRMYVWASSALAGTTVWMDDFSIVDVNAAAAALKAAQDAQLKADQAFDDAFDAMEAAGLAQSSANGKNNVLYLPALPSGTLFADGDTVFIRSAEGQPYTAQYRWEKTGETTGSWKPQLASHQTIASVDLGKATVGELDGIYIKARTLNATHIVVSDTTNIYPDPYFKLGTSRLTGGNVWEYGASLNSGKGAIKYTNTSTGTVYGPMLPDNIPVTEGSLYHFSVDAAVTNGTTPNFNIRVYFYDKDGNLSNQGVPLTINADKSVTYAGLNGTYRTLSGILAVPAGRVSMQLRPTFYATTGTGETFYLSNYRISRAANADLIVDGTITAGKLLIAGNPADPDEVSLTANFAKLMKLEVSNLIATTGSMGTAVIDELWTKVVRSRLITTDMLVVSGDNLMPNGFGETGDNTKWSAWTFDAADKPNGTFGSFTLSTQTTQYLANEVPAPKVEEDTFYVLEGWIKASVAGSRCFIEAVESGGSNPSPVYLLNSYPVPTVWTRFSVPVKTGVGNANMAFRFFANHANGTVFNATQKIAGLRYRKQFSADMIVDGGILARHLTVTDELTTKVLGAYKIKAVNIDTNDLQADTGFVGAMRTKILTADVVTATMIHATNGITSKHTITGATLQTTTTANRGVKFTSAGIDIWDAAGKNTFNANASTGYLTITGRLRTGPDGEPGVVLIPPIESTDGKTMAMWLTPDTAVLPGGVTAGVWMSNPVGGLATAGAINVRGQSHGGVNLMGRVELHSTDGSISRISSDNGYGLQITAYAGNAYLAASVGEARISSALNTFINIGTGKQLTLQSGGAAYNRTNGSAANAIIFTDGNVFKVSSASKYKIDPRPMNLDPRILDEVTVKDWIDLGMAERYAESYDHQWPYNEQEQREFDALSLERIPGTIAEDVEAAGGERFVVRDLDGEIDSLMYDRLALARTELLKVRAAEQAREIAELRSLVEELKAGLAP